MISRLPGLSLPERVWNTARRWAVAWWRILYLGAVVLVLVLSPSSYGKGTRQALARHRRQHGHVAGRQRLAVHGERVLGAEDRLLIGQRWQRPGLGTL